MTNNSVSNTILIDHHNSKQIAYIPNQNNYVSDKQIKTYLLL